jgi:hypothetical protein
MDSYSETAVAELEAIHRLLKGAVTEAETLIERLEDTARLERFRENVFEKVLAYVVDLDMATARVHQHRQRILESQIDTMVRIN